MAELTLDGLLRAFFSGGASDYDAVELAISKTECEPVDDIEPIRTLLPKSKIPVEDIFVWSTPFDNAPFLVLSRASTSAPDDSQSTLIFRTRRVFLSEISEQNLFEWVCDFAGSEPVTKKSEVGGHHSWLWALQPENDFVLQDGYRLYVASEDDMMLLERIATTQE